MARSKSNIPANETKAQKSVRIAIQRMPRVLRGIATIANLGGSGYELAEPQKKKIIDDLEKAVAAVKARFAGLGAVAAGYEL